MADKKTQLALAQWIAAHSGWISIGIFASLLGICAFFIDMRYSATIDDLRRKVKDKESEIAVEVEAKNQLLKRLSSLKATVTVHGAGSVVTEKSTFAKGKYPTTSLQLKQSKIFFFWEDQCKIKLTNTYVSLRNALFEGYLGDKLFRWDLYIDRRELISFLGSQYYVELIEVNSDSALLKIIPRR